MRAETADMERSRVPPDPKDPRLEELQRVMSSDTFAKSPRLASLLRHICERTWAGKTDELSEQQLGIHFFHRSPGFNAGEDAIVRSTARHLRKRLDLYYEAEGRGSVLRIVVPKGGYVAHLADQRTSQDLSDTEGEQPREEKVGTPARVVRGTGRKWKLAGIALVSLLMATLVGLFVRSSYSRDRQEEAYGPIALWSILFQQGKRTVIVPGDPHLNLYTAYLHRGVSLHEYNEQRYQNDSAIRAVSPEGPGDLTMIDDTTMADTKLISELVRIPYREKLPIADRNVEVRFARDANEADLHGANLILLGSSTFNPWVSLYDKNLDFQLERGFDHYTFRILNKVPRSGEPGVFTKTDEEVLTIVALTEAASDNEHVLLVEASRMGGIYAAENFLLTEKLWRDVLRSATINGKLHNFEVVLKSNFLKDEVSNTRVLASHVH